MSSISSSSTYSVSSSYSTNKGLSGLVSGMDTDTLVEQMLSGTQSKIDKVEGERQQLLWKQEMYREIITSINSFHNSFFNSSFDASSANNLASADFFNSMVSTVTSGSNALKILSSLLPPKSREAKASSATTASWVSSPMRIRSRRCSSQRP